MGGWQLGARRATRFLGSASLDSERDVGDDEGDGSPPSRGHGMGETGLVVGSDRFFTSLRYVQNDMWGALRSE